MTLNELNILVNTFIQEYTGTGASGFPGGKGGDGNRIRSPRPFPDDKSEIKNYIRKNVYGAEGGHYTYEPALQGKNLHGRGNVNHNRSRFPLFEIKN